MKSFTKTTIKTFTPTWIKKDFTTYDGDYIRVRSTFKNKMNTCMKCDYKFKLGDMIALACFDNIGNKVLCQNCAKELMSS
jgi:hypothetical protein